MTDLSKFTIHEFSNKNLGILLEKKLIIISHKTFKTNKIIEPKGFEILSSNENFIGNEFVDFIELKNYDIVIWASNIIYRIDEREHGNLYERKYYDYGSVNYYEINSIYEMKNRKLVSCNSYGLKFYEKDKDKYNLM